MIHLPPSRLCWCGVVHRIPVAADLAHQLRPFDDIFVSNAGKAVLLGGFGTASATNPDFGSLHTAYSATGANELTGGSPAYARKALTWGAISGGSLPLAATLPTWDVPAAGVVAWWGGWDAVTTGTFLFMLPAGGGVLQPCAVEVAGDITSDTIFAKAHGLVLDTRCVFWGAGMPTGLAVGTIYWVISTGLTADAFKVSATQGGGAVDLTGTSPFSFYVQKCVPETFGGQGTYPLASASIDLNLVA